MKFLVFFGILLTGTLGDEFYFNLKSWTQPVLNQIYESARHKIHDGPSLKDALDYHQRNIKLETAQRNLREEISLQLRAEMEDLMAKLQNLINYIVQFATKVGAKLNEVSSKNFKGDTSTAKLGDEFFNLYVAEAKSTIEHILKDLEKDAKEDLADHMTAKFLQQTAVEIAKELLQHTDHATLEVTILKDVKTVVDRVLSDEHQAIERALAVDMQPNIRKYVNELAPFLKGKEAEFHVWIQAQLKHAVDGARVHIDNLHMLAEQVITDACKLCHDVCKDALEYFQYYEGDLGSTWEKIESLAKGVLEQGYQVDA